MTPLKYRDKIEKTVEEERDEMVETLRKLVKIDTSVPPGWNYQECADVIRKLMESLGYDTKMLAVPPERFNSQMEKIGLPLPPEGLLPRVNVFGRKDGGRPGKTMHFTGHFDVVPVGKGWTLDPFGAEVKDGKLYGRGATDQKSGIVASLYAIEAIRRAGLKLSGFVEQSATVDEEWAGEMGLGYLVEEGYIGKGKQDHVVITECLDVDGVCLGHRGAIMFSINTFGKIGHGCMPQLAVNAVEKMGAVLASISAELRPLIESRVSGYAIMPEISRQSSISPIWIDGSAKDRPGATIPAYCTSFWNRWFNPEENIHDVRNEIINFLETLKSRDPELSVEYNENYSAEPVAVSEDGELIKALRSNIRSVLQRPSHILLSPGFDDQRFVVVNGNIESCVLYGPGILNMAHAPDEYVIVDDIVNAAKVMALSTIDLLGTEN